MKVLVIGWNENALKCIQNIGASKHRLVGVVVPEGYNTESVVEYCAKNNINCVAALRQGLLEQVAKMSPDIIVSASWPWILKADVHSKPKFGTINVHAALLPKNRGQHPLNWALIKGESETGVTVHYVEDGIDDGDIILQSAFPINLDDDINSLRQKVTTLGAELVVAALDLIQKGKAVRTKQNQTQATYAPKRLPSDGVINWERPSKEIFNLIRALATPYPNAFCHDSKGNLIKVPKAFVPGKPGMVIAKHKSWFVVTTGDGVILIKAKGLKIGDRLS